MWFSKCNLDIVIWLVYVTSDFLLIEPSHECHWALFMISHHCLRNGLVPSANKPFSTPPPHPHPTPRYYLSQCWPRYMSPHGVTEQDELFSNAWPQSVNIFKANTKWSPLCRRHVQIHFLERDILISIKISLTLLPRSDHFQHWFR